MTNSLHLDWYSSILISVGNPHAAPMKRAESLEPILRHCLTKAIDGHWEIKVLNDASSPDVRSVAWNVFLPSSRKLEDPPKKDPHFLVILTSREIRFPHPSSPFETWAQGRLMEEVADYYGRQIYHSVTNTRSRMKERTYRVGKTFSDYLATVKPGIPKDHPDWEQSHRAFTPEGYW